MITLINSTHFETKHYYTKSTLGFPTSSFADYDQEDDDDDHSDDTHTSPLVMGLNNETDPDLLPIEFEPSPYTVVVGRGRFPQNNLGNRRLRVLASIYYKEYSEARNRRTKTEVVDKIFKSIQEAMGMFVRRGIDGRWYKVDDTVAREKIGYVLRDLLGDKYKSSSKSKVARRFKKQLEKSFSIRCKPQQGAHSTFPILPESVFSIGSEVAHKPSSCTKRKEEPCNIMESKDAFSSSELLNDCMLDKFDADVLLNSPLIVQDI